MSFYLIPPSGVVGLDLLQNWTKKRACFLRNVYVTNENLSALRSYIEHETTAREFGDCLIEGSAKDCVSHFLLRLACSADASCSQVFVESESTLFRYRVMLLSKPNLLRFLRRFNRLRQHFVSLFRQDCDNTSVKEICEFLTTVGGDLCWSDVVNCFKNGCHGCVLCTCMIPFRFVTSLVAQRQVALHSGKAAVSSNHLLDVLVAVFKAWLEHGLVQARKWRNVVIAGDDRLRLIFSQCKNILDGDQQHVSGEPRVVLSSGVDEMAEYFPPCMSSLHSRLRQNHRLRHMSRVSYTLFLKSIGMPFREAVKFWQNEYSQPPSAGYRGCHHSWARDFKRYLYSVRHLYGLEGRRANYQSFTCRYIQSNLWSPTEEAGCPFKHSSLTSLAALLGCKKDSTWQLITTLISTGNYSSACQAYLNESVHIHESMNIHDVPIEKAGDSATDSGYESMQSQNSNSSSASLSTSVLDTRPANSSSASLSTSVLDTRPANSSSASLSTSVLDTRPANSSSASLSTSVLDTSNVNSSRLPKTVSSPVDYCESYRQLLCDLKSLGNSK